MNASAELIANEIVGRLDVLDDKTAPVGLYAIREFGMRPDQKRPYRPLHYEWGATIKPYLAELGCLVVSEDSKAGSFNMCGPESLEVEVQILRISKVKVRRYGSAFAADKHVSHSDRWGDLEMVDKLRGIARVRDGPRRSLRILALIGFDHGSPALRRELQALNAQVDWSEQGLAHASRSWQDRYRAGMSVEVSAWVAQRPAELKLAPDGPLRGPQVK